MITNENENGQAFINVYDSSEVCKYIFRKSEVYPRDQFYIPHKIINHFVLKKLKYEFF